MLLGPLVVRADGSLITVTAAKQRGILAALLLHANRAVTVDELTETLWDGEDLPSAARVGVQNYVMRLRKALGPAGARIITQPHGYLLKVEAGELDLHRFEDRLRDARTAARGAKWPDAAYHASAALALWRGEPLADLGSDLLAAREGPRLAELRLQALETRVDADLHLGRHGEVIAELRQLAAEHPLRERLHALLMLALYRDGRQAEALAAYQHACAILAEELGAEPGQDLQRLHQQILGADPALVQPATGQTAPEPAALVPRELPADVAAFTGRAAELAELDRLLLGQPDAPDDRKPTAAVISAVSGTAGVGKTALAINWAHHAAGNFPDGQLYVNLRGYDPDQPMTSTDALAGFLRSLGVPGQDIPPDETERAARYRSLLSGKRMLIVLDNASTVDQVRPLLPGHPGCAVLVTSRDSLAGLVARDGARRLELDLLPLADAVALLRELIGARVDTEPDAAVTLAEQCARLPIALRITAELAAARPDVPLAHLVAELNDQQQRLDLLTADGDPRTAVRAVFSWSYDHLDHGTANTFRLAGLHPGPDFDLYAVAALTGSSLAEARRVTDRLARVHLIQPSAPGRYGMHDLLRFYAGGLSAAHDSEAERTRALGRLFDYYLHAATSARNVLFPVERHRWPITDQPGWPMPTHSDHVAARAWFASERNALLAVAHYAADQGWLRHSTRLAVVLRKYLETAGFLSELTTLCARALRASRLRGDISAQAEALNGLGVADWRQGRYRAAAEHLHEALALFRQTGDLVGQARTLSGLSTAEFYQGDYDNAADHLRESAGISRAVGDKSGEARRLGDLSLIDHRRGDRNAAADHLLGALALFREIGDRAGEAICLSNLAVVEAEIRSYQHANDHVAEALALYREIGDRTSEGHAHDTLGFIEQQQGRYAEAAARYRRALAIHTETGNQAGQAAAHNGLGEVFVADAGLEMAKVEYAAALELARRIGEIFEQARAHDGLGRCYCALGEPDQARHQWRQALDLYTELGIPEADEVRARLAAPGSREGAAT